MNNVSLDLRRRLHALSVQAAQLSGAHKSDLDNSERLTAEVALAKGRNLLGEEVARVFNAMQERSHSRSVGSLELLLTAILNDVLPDEGAVRMLPQYKNNNTHLDILLDKNGCLEDVLDGNGGAVTNVICAGLRFAALARTTNRRLMVLDEPDCWLKPERVPPFVRTIAEVSVQTNTQTFFITHHDPAFFEGHFNIVRFSADAKGKVSANALLPRVSSWTDASQPGVRAIELFNVRRHEHTLVPCFPGGTAYIGDNNLGKSTALVTAFKVVAYGESDDSLIRHGCEEARIVFHLEDEKRIEWSRHVKRSPAVIYKLFQGAELLAEGRPKTRNQAPEWVTDVLGVSRVDDLDIQVGNQKSPVFLLNDTASRRAQILSVGRESSHLKSLMKGYDELKTSDREAVKQGEASLARLKLRLTYLARLLPVDERLQALLSRSEAMLKDLEDKEKLETFLSRIEAATEKLVVTEQENKALASVPALPYLKENDALGKLLEKLESLARYQKVGEVPSLPLVPELHNLAGLEQAGAKISRATSVIFICEKLSLELPAVPALLDEEALLRVTNKTLLQIAEVAAAGTELLDADNHIVSATKSLEALKEELGGDCPLCGAAFTTNTVEAHIHHVH